MSSLASSGQSRPGARVGTIAIGTDCRSRESCNARGKAVSRLRATRISLAVSIQTGATPPNRNRHEAVGLSSACPDRVLCVPYARWQPQGVRVWRGECAHEMAMLRRTIQRTQRGQHEGATSPKRKLLDGKVARPPAPTGSCAFRTHVGSLICLAFEERNVNMNWHRLGALFQLLSSRSRRPLPRIGRFRARNRNLGLFWTS